MEEHFMDPDEALVKRIYELVELQHSKKQISEVGGSVFEKEGGIEFRVIVPKFHREASEAVDKFAEGDYNAIEKIYEYVAAVTGDASQLPEEVRPVAINFKQTVFWMMAGWKLGEKRETKRAVLVAKMVREMLERTYNFEDSEMEMDEPGYLGGFHVHPDGSAPTQGDLDPSHEIDMLVFAGKKDFRKTGIMIYCIEDGDIAMERKV